MNRQRIPKISIGDIVAVHFLDHAEDSDSPLAFIVYGRVIKNVQSSYTIEAWTFEDINIDRNKYRGDTVKKFTIVKRAVTSIDILQKGDN